MGDPARFVLNARTFSDRYERMDRRLVLAALVLSVALWVSATGGIFSPPESLSRLRVLVCVSDRYVVEPEEWEQAARGSLGPEDSGRSRSNKSERAWRLPPQAGLPRGGSLTLVTFDGGGTCEADRSDPRAIVIADPERVHGAVRLPNNAQWIEPEVIDGGGGRLVIVFRSEVWRGYSNVIVATWDPTGGSVTVALDTKHLPAERNYGYALQSSRALPTAAPMPTAGQRHVIEGVMIDLVRTR